VTSIRAAAPLRAASAASATSWRARAVRLALAMSK
jgi:hypothetical protein